MQAFIFEKQYLKGGHVGCDYLVQQSLERGRRGI